MLVDINEATLEKCSEAVHKSYCEDYKLRHGKDYWTKGNYSLLNERTKDIDRKTARAVLCTITKLGENGLWL